MDHIFGILKAQNFYYYFFPPLCWELNPGPHGCSVCALSLVYALRPSAAFDIPKIRINTHMCKCDDGTKGALPLRYVPPDLFLILI